ncbi:glycoside hydrolase domain-containing protein [Cellulomonas sp. Y8]|uniref:glycoside hydrolase domain-containing protein n=1 Tax=Cellulomonas sp. Y8 TaxID=2591145 RepID=UPI003D70D320
MRSRAPGRSARRAPESAASSWTRRTLISGARTWSSLLVSTGDPDRPARACDTATEATVLRAETLWDIGYRTVGRYLTNVAGGTLDKRLKNSELDILLQMGFTVFPIFQEVGNTVSAFSYAKGRAAAQRAFAAAYRIRIPAGTTIYFAVDFDPTGTEITGSVIPYFQGIASVMNQRAGYYRVGVYGTRNVCRQLDDADLAGTSFVAGMSTGYSGNLGFALPRNWAFDQIQERTVGAGSGAIAIDKDVMSGRDPGLSARDPEGANDPFLRMLDLVWMEALSWISTHPGSAPAAELVCQFYRRSAHNNEQFTALMGEVDQAFVNEVLAVLGATDWDPNADATAKIAHPDFPARSISADHLFAALNGYLHRGIPTGGGTPDTADIGGWAGDLISTLNGYQAAVNAGYAGNLGDYAADTLLIDTDALSNRFGLADFVEDCTGFNVANAYALNPAVGLPDHMRQALSAATPRENCFMRFWRSRTHDSSASATALGENTMAGSNGVLFDGIRSLLLLTGSPSVSLSDYSEQDRAALGRTFGDRLLALRG